MKRQQIRIARYRSTGMPPLATRRAAAKGRARSGVSAVEFAVVANVLLLMILTCMEFARVNMVRSLAQDAAYFAARHAIVPGATSEEAIDEAERILSSMLSNGYTVTVDDVNADSSDVTVRVSVDLTEVALFAPYFMPDSIIETTARMRTERYDGFYQQ
jgi:Flp pilus assembly protein TadG